MSLDNTYDRKLLEKYYTPTWVSEALFQNYIMPTKVWEPAAGSGNISDYWKTLGFEVVSHDIAPDREDIKKADFLLWKDINYDGDIITNPPYGKKGELAVSFIEQALTLTKHHKGKVCMLLKADFDSASTRKHLFKNNPYFDMKIVLLNRIKWTNVEDKGVEPRFNHAWYVWDYMKDKHEFPFIKYYSKDKKL